MAITNARNLHPKGRFSSCSENLFTYGGSEANIMQKFPSMQQKDLKEEVFEI